MKHSVRNVRKRIIVDRGGELPGGAQHYGNSETEALGDLLSDTRGNGLGNGSRAAEQDVAALDIRSDIGTAGVSKDFREIPHRDAVLTANVDATQQREICRCSHSSRKGIKGSIAIF
jgi:hypothetical protein